MAKKTDTATYWANMLETGLHKRNQGRLTRQLSAVAFGLVLLLGAWTLSNGPLSEFDNPAIHVGIPVASGTLLLGVDGHLDDHEATLELERVARVGVAVLETAHVGPSCGVLEDAVGRLR